ncbi:MAG TPA: hypothetical protein VGS12_14660 [Caulobacteraceae bacterium]|nr:hypothetical protein [Caulobacteraceae bacterium]
MFSKRSPLIFGHDDLGRTADGPGEPTPAFRPLELEDFVNDDPPAPDEAAPASAPEPATRAADLAFPRFAPPRHAETEAEAAPEPEASSIAPGPLPLTRPPRASRAEARGVFGWALAASIAWAAALAGLGIAFPQTMTPVFRGPVAAAALVMILAAPVALIWAAALAIGEGRALLAEARRARRFAEQLAGPSAAAAAGAQETARALQESLDQTARAAAATTQSLSSLRQVLGTETERLTDATSAADIAAGKLVVSLGNQRTELSTLAVTLEARAAAVTDAMNRQQTMVGQASDLAESQLAEAQAMLAARAADLAAAAIRVGEASRSVAEDLAGQAARLETAGAGVGEQLRIAEEGLAEQRAALVAIAHGLRADQEEFAALAETRTAQLTAMISGASKDTQGLTEAAAQAASAISDIVEKTAARQAELTAQAQAERERFEATATSAAATLAQAAQDQRAALDEELEKTRTAFQGALAEALETAKAQSETAREGVSRMNEAVAAAGEAAEKAFEQRLAECRELVEKSAKLIDEAGDRAAHRLEQSLAAANAAIGELKGLAEETLSAVAALPGEAAARGDEVRAALAKGLEDLTTQARRAAEETAAIDQAFQERVKRNYDMLSEAVQLMGVVARSGQAASAPRPSAKREPSASLPSAQRARIKLSAPPEAAPAETENADDEQRWSDMLHADGAEEAGGQEGDGASPFHEIASMGIDPAALLSRSRIQEIAGHVQSGAEPAARDLVRTLAPAATRRLSRRLMTDADFAGRSRGFTDRYAGRLRAAAAADPAGLQVASLLTSDQGRAFLLLDAARLGAG